MKKFIQEKSNLILEVLLIAILCSIILSFIRLQESYYLESNLFEKYEAYNSIFDTCFIDFKACLVFSITLFPFALLFKKIRLIATFLFGLVVLVHGMLTKYFITNFDLLGDEILNFAFNEIIFIINTEKTSFQWFDFMLIVLYPILFIGFVFLLYRYKKWFSNHITKKILLLFYFIFIIASLVDYKYFLADYSRFESYQKYTLNNNKVSYFFSEIIKTKLKKYKATDVQNYSEQLKNYQNSNPHFHYTDKNFPLMHDEPYTNVLGNFFESKDIKPNIVFVLVESLSRSFSGPNAHLGSFTPFLDSLKNESLYWENFLSNAERTYGVLPNVLASAPFFDQFVSNEEYATHNSIIKELKKEAYYSDFHYGGWENFSKRGPFVRFNQIDDLYADKSFDTTIFKIHKATENDFHWGYDDKALLEQYFIHTKNIQEPFLSIILTLSMHSPFDVNHDYTTEDAKKYLGENLSKYQKELMVKHPKKIRSIAFSDQYLKVFFEEYKKKESFKNTIFVLLGDHNIHALPIRNELDIFHVPLLIYSDLLTQKKSFKSVSTHREITPSLLGLLENNYNLSFSKDKHWLGYELDTCSYFRSKINTPMCLNYSKYINYLYEDHFVFKDNVYQFDSLLNITKQEDTAKANKVYKLFEDYSVIEKYIHDNNRLFK